MNDQEFRDKADHALTDLKAKLMQVEEDADFEVEEQSGALHLSFENPPGKFVISPNSAAKQIWISALSTSYKLDWHEGWKAFVLTKTAEPLTILVERLINEQLGTAAVRLTT